MQYAIRPLESLDNPQVARLVRTVMPEFGCVGAGYAIQDPEVDDMHSTYTQARSAYFVVTDGERVLGGGGFAPLKGGSPDVCELRKMYFLPELRGNGLGQKLMDLCLESARGFGYRQMYLETMDGMRQARTLYERNGFIPLTKPMGDTGHFSCDTWYVRAL